MIPPAPSCPGCCPGIPPRRPPGCCRSTAGPGQGIAALSGSAKTAAPLGYRRANCRPWDTAGPGMLPWAKTASRDDTAGPGIDRRPPSCPGMLPVNCRPWDRPPAPQLPRDVAGQLPAPQGCCRSTAGPGQAGMIPAPWDTAAPTAGPGIDRRPPQGCCRKERRPALGKERQAGLTAGPQGYRRR